METTAKLNGVRLSPQKGRLVADQIRGLQVEKALNLLSFSPKKGAVIIRKVLESAVEQANALQPDLILWAATMSARTWNPSMNSHPFLANSTRSTGCSQRRAITIACLAWT